MRLPDGVYGSPMPAFEPTPLALDDDCAAIDRECSRPCQACGATGKDPFDEEKICAVCDGTARVCAHCKEAFGRRHRAECPVNDEKRRRRR